MVDAEYYARLGERFTGKRTRAVGVLEELGFRIYDSGSTFYVWARIPDGFGDAMGLNEKLIAQAGVAAVAGRRSPTRPLGQLHAHCIAREEHILDAALGKLRGADRRLETLTRFSTGVGVRKQEDLHSIIPTRVCTRLYSQSHPRHSPILISSVHAAALS